MSSADAACCTTLRWPAIVPDGVLILVHTSASGRRRAHRSRRCAILDQNRQALPPGFDLEELKRDFAAFDALRPRLNRLEALAAKCADTQVALGSDILAACYDGYALLKVFGKADNVAPLRESMRSGVRRNPPAGKAGAA